jgi:hypothetical protein
MLKVTSNDFQRNTACYLEKAFKEAVSITRCGRDHLVIIRAEAYHALRQRARTAMTVGDLPEAYIQRFHDTNMSSEHEHLNAEMDKQDLQV